MAGLRHAARCKPGDVDVLELRLDALEGRLPATRKILPTLRLPVLVTARHPAEGGCGGLTLRRRKQLLTEFLPAAALIDVELRSVVAMRDVILAAKARGVVVVVSDHHFRGTPPLARLLHRQRMAFAAGADAFKLATLAGDAKSLARLLDLAAAPAAGPRAIMGMGKFGKASRLTLAVAGSVLNYGYLDQPNAPGQWEAKDLRNLLNRITL
jgi:3-dehydroquinate dehydratase-1